jgi:hypothetical protein
MEGQKNKKDIHSRLKVFENRVRRREHLDIRDKKSKEGGENCIMKSFITCTLHQILLSDIGESD